MFANRIGQGAEVFCLQPIKLFYDPETKTSKQAPTVSSVMIEAVEVLGCHTTTMSSIWLESRGPCMSYIRRYVQANHFEPLRISETMVFELCKEIKMAVASMKNAGIACHKIHHTFPGAHVGSFSSKYVCALVWFLTIDVIKRSMETYTKPPNPSVMSSTCRHLGWSSSWGVQWDQSAFHRNDSVKRTCELVA